MLESGDRRIQVVQDGVATPLLSAPPRLSSAGHRWEGFLLEELVAPPIFEAAEHEHDTHVVLVHTGAAASVEWRTGSHTVHTQTEPGSASIAAHGVRHSIAIKRDEPGGLLLMEIAPDHLQRLLQDSKPGWRPVLVEHLDLRDRHIEFLVRAMLDDVKSGSPVGTLYGESLGNALAIYLLQRYGSSPSNPVTYKGGMPSARLRRVIDYIEANLDENALKLSQLAEVAGVSLYHFAKLFKQSTGESPHQFVIRRRIERAKNLLRNPNTSVLEASVRTGFADQRHFAKVFRRLVGTNPSSYRLAI